MKYSALRLEIESKTNRIKEILSKEVPTAEEVDEAQQLDKEVSDLEAKSAGIVESLKNKPEPKLDGGLEEKMENQTTIGDLFVESEAFKAYSAHKAVGVEVSVPFLGSKTTMTTSSGFAPFIQRLPRVGTYPTAPNSLMDIVPVQPVTTGGAIKYMRETTFTNNADATAEAGSIGEAALALTEVTCSLRKIAVWLPVTEEQLSDVDGMRAYLNNRLSSMVVSKAASQLFHGSGTAPYCDGLDSFTISNSVNKTSYSNTLDAVAKAIQQVRGNGMEEPTHIVVTPKVWFDLHTEKASTAGVYLAGDPTGVGLPTLWGIPLVVAPAFSPSASGNASVYVGAFSTQAFIAAAPEISFAITDSHSTYFASGVLAVRASIRLNLGLYRPLAFAKVTNITLT